LLPVCCLHPRVVVVSLVALPAPPRATLFPYTTLFRSPRRGRPAPVVAPPLKYGKGGINAARATRLHAADQTMTRGNAMPASFECVTIRRLAAPALIAAGGSVHGTDSRHRREARRLGDARD